MAKRALTTKLIPKTYAALRNAVLAVVVEGRQAIDRAWVESYHEIGRLIHEHLLFKQARAAYGAEVFSDLSKESGISSRTLHECVQFYRRIPIVRHGAQFNWAHYRVFCQIEDASTRVALMAEGAKRGWTSPQLIAQVRAINAAIEIEATPGGADRGKTRTAHEPLVLNRGTPGLHLIVEKSIGRAVDLGFRHYWPLTPEQAKRFAKGDIVRIASDDSIRLAPDATKADLFTYAAQLVRVVDGDTLVVALEVSPGEFLEQKLRLRGLDCPEMSTPEGKAAKHFVEALMTKTTAITINTTKPDKYDRYLADVFLTTDSGEIFLNNHLLENGHAVRKDAADFGDDWGFK